MSEEYYEDSFCCVECEYGICEECHELFEKCKCYELVTKEG